ncbi:MAG: 4'-phosphopantetheinyl transferase superfamily protein [Oscillospiraceae bacterium]|nr:4'-phosphopantetheinyl transferase superfamily protein [Oscillospiraceae bacterium]
MRWTCGDIREYTPEELETAYLQLSSSRKEHLDRIRREEDKNRSLVATILVSRLLKEFGYPEATLQRAENGQPYLSGCDLFVSISHSKSKVVCAIDTQPVGIDIEKIRPIDMAVCRHVCLEEESAYVWADQEPYTGTCRDTDILRRFFEVWAAKEAWFKKCGTGITDLKSVNVLPLQYQTHLLEGYLIQII